MQRSPRQHHYPTIHPRTSTHPPRLTYVIEALAVAERRLLRHPDDPHALEALRQARTVLQHDHPRVTRREIEDSAARHAAAIDAYLSDAGY